MALMSPPNPLLDTPGSAPAQLDDRLRQQPARLVAAQVGSPAAPASRERSGLGRLGYSLAAIMLAELYGVSMFFLLRLTQGSGLAAGSGQMLPIAMVLVPVGLVVSEVLCVIKRAWFGVVLIPFALLSGMIIAAYISYAR